LQDGYSGWCGVNQDGSKAPLADWDQVALDGCRVYLAFGEGGAATTDASEARQEFIAFLASKGSEVRVLQIPARDTEGDGDTSAIIGIDDYLAGGGDLEQLMPRATALDGDEPDSVRQRIGWLAEISDVEYEQVRENAAKDLGFRARVLDKARNKLLEDRGKAAQIAAQAARGNVTPDHPYFSVPGDGMFCARFNRNGIYRDDLRLTNFTPVIKQRNTYAEGGKRTREYVIEADFQGKITRVTVPLKDYTSMRWMEQMVPPGANCSPSQEGKARHAIVQLSIPIKESRTYGDMGWQLASNGSWFYFHAGGVIGEGGANTGIKTRLQGVTAEMKLELPSDAKQRAVAIRASLDIRNAGPLRITIPLLAGTYAVALGRCNFSFHLSGKSGLFKSSLAALAQQHFGRLFRFDHLPASWASTAARLQLLQLPCSARQHG
jgi:hypothetical protein